MRGGHSVSGGFCLRILFDSGNMGIWENGPLFCGNLWP